jgi:AraC-like DNA-binding protein
MEPIQSLEEFYNQKLNFIPDNLKKEMGHFNVFNMDAFLGTHAKPIPYSRKDYFKISLLNGRKRLSYADKVIDVTGCALLFANPLIPYKWEPLAEEQSGYFCIFTEAFINHFGNIREYPLFQPGNIPVFPLSETQKQPVQDIYLKMLEEIRSDYTYKYDVLRNLVFDLIHTAMKMQPAPVLSYSGLNAANRISSLFIELLDRQFPIECPAQRMSLRSPSEFGSQLSVHINHLNRALKETTGKTTSQMISDRVAREAQSLLRYSNWNIGEIAWSLGFEELSPFINFFKKTFNQSPRSFRNTHV